MFKTRKFSRDRSRLFCPVNISSTAFVFKEGDSAIEGDFWASVLLSLEAVDLLASSLGFFSASSLVFDWTEGPSRFVLVFFLAVNFFVGDWLSVDFFVGEASLLLGGLTLGDCSLGICIFVVLFLLLPVGASSVMSPD